MHESGELPNLFFYDEKPFPIDQFVNKQNDRVYLPKRSAAIGHLNLSAADVMLWAAVTADGRSPLAFIDRGVKINYEYCRENVLKTVLKPWADKHFGRSLWKFQQDVLSTRQPRMV